MKVKKSHLLHFTSFMKIISRFTSYVVHLFLPPKEIKLFSISLPYLLLVSFLSGQINDFGMDKIKAINESPYDGVAIMMIGGYDTGKYSEKDFEKAVNLFKKESKKHIWPWVFFNRFIGFEPGGKTKSKLADEKYFRDIEGMDIFNKAGALKDFLDLWKNALKISKRLGSPGIVVDPEAYNNSEGYNIPYLSKQLKRSEDEIKHQLESVGGELADIAQQEYPTANIWFLFDGMGGRANKLKQYLYGNLSITYIIDGMLKRAKLNKLTIKIISGGESSLGYCYESLNQLAELVDRRRLKYDQFLSDYPNLELGGPIALWKDPSERKGFTIKGRCGKSEFRNINDFKPALQFLFKTYKYVWVYAAVVSGYNPYDQEGAIKINHFLSEIHRE